MEEHTHRWMIITAIEYMGWDDFMRYRGEEKDMPVVMETVTHKIFCTLCKEIKTIT